MFGDATFGIIIAYLLPGFIGMTGLAPLFPTVMQWLQPVHQEMLGFGPPIYAMLSALTVGLITSCVRWLFIDHLLEVTGVSKPVRDHDTLTEKLDAYAFLHEAHYRHYQFYSNTLVALLFAYIPNRMLQSLPLLGPGTDLGVILLCAILLAGSRDTLRKYRVKLRNLLGKSAGKEH